MSIAQVKAARKRIQRMYRPKGGNAEEVRIKRQNKTGGKKGK